MYGSDLKKRLGIILTVVGAILACAVPFALVVLRHQQLEELSNPTPEELKSTHWPMISAFAGMVVSAVGVWFIFQANKK
jgi:hypothetical protein